MPGGLKCAAFVPGINIRFTEELKCGDCNEMLARPGDSATLHSEEGAVLLVNDANPPKGLAVRLECKNGHRTEPVGCNLEYWFLTPKGTQEAPGRAIARI
jgi:hypothetical protein